MSTRTLIIYTYWCNTTDVYTVETMLVWTTTVYHSANVVHETPPSRKTLVEVVINGNGENFYIF